MRSPLLNLQEKDTFEIHFACVYQSYALLLPIYLNTLIF